MINVFISYASEDYIKVKEIVIFLKNYGYNIWIDKDDILPGENWKDALRRGLNQADFVIICLSENSVSKRGFIRKEMRFALDKVDEMLDDDIYMIPVRLDDCVIPDNLSDIQCVNFNSKSGRNNLLKSLFVGSEKRGLCTEGEDVNTESEDRKDNISLSSFGGERLLNFLAGIKNK